MARVQFILPYNAKLEDVDGDILDFKFHRGDLITITDTVTYYEGEGLFDIPTRRGTLRSVIDGKFEFLGDPEVHIIEKEENVSVTPIQEAIAKAKVQGVQKDPWTD